MYTYSSKFPALKSAFPRSLKPKAVDSTMMKMVEECNLYLSIARS